MKTQCIYEIVNTVNQRKYIGSSVDYDRRVKRHLRLLNKNKHHSRYLQNAWNHYGNEKFEFHILELVPNKNELITREMFYISKLNPEYNTMRDVKSHIGLKRSDETRQKISLSQLGKKHSWETKEKLRQLNLGTTQSDETIQKRILSMKSSEKFQQAVKSKDRTDKIRETRIRNGGYIVTDDQKRKISETLKSRKLQSAISIKIQKYDLDGKFICEYPSFQKAEIDSGFWRGSLHQNLKILKKEIYKNFIWKII